jgi:hypothetical protein
MYTCRECERPVNQATELCPYCGADLTLPAETDSGVQPKKKPTLRSALARWGLLLGAMLLFVWFILLLPGPGTRDGGAAAAERRAVESLRAIQAALADYAEVRGGEFPPTLEALTAPAVREAARSAQSEGYRLDYQPAPADPDGIVRRYALRARPGFHGFRNFYTDQSGVIRATRRGEENRPAGEHDPPVEEP